MKKAIYTSPEKKKTMLYLEFDDDQAGFKKNFFAKGQRRAGTTALGKCEVP